MTDISAQQSFRQRTAPFGNLIGTLSLDRVAASTFIWLDLLERTILATLFGFFAIRMTASFDLTSGVAVPLLLASEIVPILLIVFRKWSNAHAMSTNPFDWLLAFVGANTSLLAEAAAPDSLIPQAVCSLVILSGLLVQISAKLVLWRSFGIVAAVRDVKVGGPYRLVRHPMYAGYTIAHIGFLLAFPSRWNLVVYSSALLVQIARLLREEQILTSREAYRQYACDVRYRLLPGIF